MPFERLLHVVMMRVRALFRSRALDTELDEELRWHVDHLVEAHIERGMSPEAARRAALVIQRSRRIAAAAAATRPSAWSTGPAARVRRRTRRWIRRSR